MHYFKYTSSTETKKELFNKVKSDKEAMNDLGNILKEKIIHEFVAKGNLCNINEIKENIDDYLFNVFDEIEFNSMIDELTLNKKNGNSMLFYLKDSNLKYLDMSYYYSYIDKSNAQKYIFDFKKDKVKSYNNYFYKSSKLTFDFFEKVYENLMLNNHNLEIIIKIAEKLLLRNQEVFDISISIKNSLLPVILKYLSIFGSINNESFIKFKINNEKLMDKLNQILIEAISKNYANNIIDREFKDNLKEVINQLNLFKLINTKI